MSKSKIRRPRKTMPAARHQPQTERSLQLNMDPVTLVTEFQELNQQVSQINEVILNLRKQISVAQAEGQKVLGKLEILARILNGMGVNPNNYPLETEPVEEDISGEEGDFSEEIEENMVEVVESTRDVRLEAILKRLNK